MMQAHVLQQHAFIPAHGESDSVRAITTDACIRSLCGMLLMLEIVIHDFDT
jgi:hypothetical protein